jgi:hypothetical protein
MLLNIERRVVSQSILLLISIVSIYLAYLYLYLSSSEVKYGLDIWRCFQPNLLRLLYSKRDYTAETQAKTRWENDGPDCIDPYSARKAVDESATKPPARTSETPAARPTSQVIILPDANVYDVIDFRKKHCITLVTLIANTRTRRELPTAARRRYQLKWRTKTQ